MASTSQTNPISISNNRNVKEANLDFSIIDGSSETTSNIEVDSMWGQLFPLFQINQAIWAPHHHNTSFFWHFLCQTMVGLQLHVIHNNFDAYMSHETN
jgi:hypothetical protein